MDAAVAEPVPPKNIKIDHVSSESVSLSWDKRVGIPEACLVICSCDGKEVQKKTTVFNMLLQSESRCQVLLPRFYGAKERDPKQFGCDICPHK
ncbi:unnamed protein product, partial [Coregonus sp. 'balchen']